ncbi:MAG: hypothetical protein BGO98_16330 [Myxococcales bacterium 68-20]|nr:hypothetical protein [Myxococcales bacterium]OJY31589.1 MAG: hypothetical protein BGO98_16330 [Myxococcales bacterium 68-20]
MARTLELIVAIASIAMFVGTLAAIPWLVRRLPADHFVRAPPKHSLPKMIARNVLGFILVAAGIAMLVLPGQGVLTILLGLSIIDLPIRQRVFRWLLMRPKVVEVMQGLRTKGGKPPLVIPEHPVQT